MGGRLPGELPPVDGMVGNDGNPVAGGVGAPVEGNVGRDGNPEPVTGGVAAPVEGIVGNGGNPVPVDGGVTPPVEGIVGNGGNPVPVDGGAAPAGVGIVGNGGNPVPVDGAMAPPGVGDVGTGGRPVPVDGGVVPPGRGEIGVGGSPGAAAVPPLSIVITLESPLSVKERRFPTHADFPPTSVRLNSCFDASFSTNSSSTPGLTSPPLTLTTAPDFKANSPFTSAIPPAVDHRSVALQPPPLKAPTYPCSVT